MNLPCCHRVKEPLGKRVMHLIATKKKPLKSRFPSIVSTEFCPQVLSRSIFPPKLRQYDFGRLPIFVMPWPLGFRVKHGGEVAQKIRTELIRTFGHTVPLRTMTAVIHLCHLMHILCFSSHSPLDLLFFFCLVKALMYQKQVQYLRLKMSES